MEVVIVLLKKHSTTMTVINDDEDDKDVDNDDSDDDNDDGDVDVGCAHQEKSLVLFHAIAQRTILGGGGYPGGISLGLVAYHLIFFVFKGTEINATIISVING